MVLVQLPQRYRGQCDGDWEHSYGVKIETLDNPGWLVTIDLTDTTLGGVAAEEDCPALRYRLGSE